MSDAQNDSQDVLIVGAGSAGVATASSLLKRNKGLNIAFIDPSEDHYYQAGQTMVGGGIFDAQSPHRKTKDLIPNGTRWVKNSVSTFYPDRINDGTKPSKFTWFLKASVLPWIYWNGMLKGREWLAK